jgi:hypothetical protein
MNKDHVICLFFSGRVFESRVVGSGVALERERIDDSISEAFTHGGADDMHTGPVDRQVGEHRRRD